MNFELLIENRNRIFQPLTIDNARIITDRKGSAGKLTFTVVKDSIINFVEGNAVRVSVNGTNMFYGFVFTKRRDKQHHIGVVAYDQLRYFMNKDTKIYSNLTASELITEIANDYELNLGTIAPTSFRIASRVEDNVSFFDMIYNALDLDMTNTKQMFVMYDNFGRLTLKPLDDMKLDLIIDDETGENFDYSSSIDHQTYNRVKLSFENNNTGKRDIYVVQHGRNINNWGILQYFDKLKASENGEAKAAALLDLYNAKTRNLKILNAFGDPRVRGGSLIIVRLGLGDINVQNFMLVERCVHKFRKSEHFMDLTLRGGEFVA